MTVYATFMFSAGRQTWSESHYWMTGSTIGTAFTAAATELANARAALLGHNATLDNVRMSDTTQKRNVLYLNSSMFNHSGAFPVDDTVDTYTADRPNASILCRFKGASRYTLKYLAGAPDGVIVEDPRYPNGIKILPGFATAFNAWALVLKNTWGFRIKNNFNKGPIDSFGSNANYPGLIAVHTPEDLGVTINQEVQVTGTKRINPAGLTMNGIFSVRKIIPAPVGEINNTYILNGTYGVDPNNFSVNGFIAQLAYTQIAYQGALLEKAVTRKRGGSIGLAHGKLKTRR